MRPQTFLTAYLFLTMLPASLPAGKFNKQLSVGDAAPAWKDLIGIDQARHSMKEEKETKYLIVCFTRNFCPVSRAYEQRLIQLSEDYAKQSVKMIAICVSYEKGEIEEADPDEQLELMAKHASEVGFPFDYLYDHSQEIGRAYGAAVTPHVFLLDPERKVIYMGAVDDNWQEAPSQETRQFLRDALDAALAGKPVPVAETQAIGCRIEYEQQDENSQP